MQIYHLSHQSLYTGLTTDYPGSIAPAGSTAVPPPAFLAGHARRFDATGQTWSQVPLTELVQPDTRTLDTERTAKLAAFSASLARLDALKIRPASAIAEALVAAEPPDPGDAYRISELEAITQENRELRKLASTVATLAELEELSPWWPITALEETNANSYIS